MDEFKWHMNHRRGRGASSPGDTKKQLRRQARVRLKRDLWYEWTRNRQAVPSGTSDTIHRI